MPGNAAPYHAAHNDQQNRLLEYRIRRVRLPERWSLESFPFEQQHGLEKAQILQLAELDVIAKAANIIFVGETGVEKTGLAVGLLLNALQAGHRGSSPPFARPTEETSGGRAFGAEPATTLQ